ncbi:hypothetical protein [Xanthomonas sp. WHRI 8932A]|uniref:hypothetical protein n=1 Tax=unclassified Xanthomonas TaxID=2643310 RepID=UPI002B236FB2|nr:hypothetical protein [Xanthomonas sp. WHRI 8932A]MEA9566266.1 hypothetical protein [Xanthomonas sp. WHRI 8932A]
MQESIDLPPIPELRRVTQSLAMLDAILSPEWDCRYHSFNSAWAAEAEMASMRNGSGDEWFLLLDQTGAAIKGFAHEVAGGSIIPQEIRAQVPAEFSSFLNEPAFSMQHATFCYWRRAEDSAWSKVLGSLDDDGADEMLWLLVSGPSGYKEWAEDYFEVPVALDAVKALFAHQPLSEAIILRINPEADIDFTCEQAREIGYP